MHTLVAIAEAQPNIPRTFRACWTVDRAVKLATVKEGATVRFVQYGTDARDVRFVVNFYGSNPRPARKTSTVRHLMRNGLTVNRRLPVVVQDRDGTSFVNE